MNKLPINILLKLGFVGVLSLSISGCIPDEDELPYPAVSYVTGSTQKICQLVGEYDRDYQEYTLNRTESNYGVWGTDLGVTFCHKDKYFMLFGDTWGDVGGDRDSIAYFTDDTPEDCLALTFVTDAFFLEQTASPGPGFQDCP